MFKNIVIFIGKHNFLYYETEYGIIFHKRPMSKEA